MSNNILTYNILLWKAHFSLSVGSSIQKLPPSCTCVVELDRKQLDRTQLREHNETIPSVKIVFAMKIGSFPRASMSIIIRFDETKVS